ncbi:MAG: chorismate synthase [Chloroflexi bacterium]|nr:chorismate synthase [Chloroflexota bacterium]
MFRFLTAGESHGKALTVIIDGVPAGLPLDEDCIAADLSRRQGGYGRGGRMKIERDRAEILSGVRHGLTLGSPISLLIPNRDWENWTKVMGVSLAEGEVEPVTRLRPGHADLAGAIKYGQRDVRNILERASARETAVRVAAGAVARRFLWEFGIQVHSHTVAIGGCQARTPGQVDWDAVEASPVRCADDAAEETMMAAIDEAKAAGDTLGGAFDVVATGAPIGLGSHVHWDRRLDGLLAQAVMSINAVKAVEIGSASAAAGLRGSQVHDIIEFHAPVEPRLDVGAHDEETCDAVPPQAADERGWRHATNRAGGIEGGMSNGEPIVVRGVMKPIPTLAKPLPSVDLATGEAVQAHIERSDVCVVPAAGVVAEAMVAIVLAQAMLEKFGGDNMRETLRNYRGYLEEQVGI